MRNLKTARILASVFCLLAAICYVVLYTRQYAFGAIADVQIVPSRLYLAAMFWVSLFWVIVTLFLGRVYCSSVCPVGTLQDVSAALARKLKIGRHSYRYKRPKRIRFHFLVIYLVSLVFGVGMVTVLMEPWPLFQQMGGLVHQENLSAMWSEIGTGALGGLIAGGVSLVVVCLCAVYFGRDFCNVYCPLGTILGAVSERSLLQIYFDPDRCSGCLKCEEVCKASCIKVTERRVDNSRCIRCFNCLDACADKALYYGKDPNRPASPLLTRTGT